MEEAGERQDVPEVQDVQDVQAVSDLPTEAELPPPAQPLDYGRAGVRPGETPEQQGESVRWFGYIAVVVTVGSMLIGLGLVGWVIYWIIREGLSGE